MVTEQRKSREIVEAGLARRRRREKLFRATGLLATAVGVIFLGVFFATLIVKGSSAFVQTFIELDVEMSEGLLAPDGELDLDYADFDGLVRNALRAEFPDVSGRSERRELYRLVSVGAGYQLREMLQADASLVGTTVTVWVPAAATVDMLVKGNIDPIHRGIPAPDQRCPGGLGRVAAGSRPPGDPLQPGAVHQWRLA